MSKFLVSILIGAMAIASPVIAQTTQPERPAGYQGTECDADAFTPVRSDRTGEILYWMNATCPAASGSGPAQPSEIDNGDHNGFYDCQDNSACEG